MDFFEAQEQARRKTKWLVLWFILSIIGVVAAVDALIFFTMGQNAGSGLGGLLLVSSAATAGLILAASGFKSMQLSSGGAVVAKDLGGRLLMPGTGDHKEKQLLNIVEEMAIASGMPVPQVYLMDNEEGINAFAAGTEPSNAVIGVTRGTLQRLNREELSGVVAHEFSHILNGDMRLNMRLIGLVFGLVVISIVGRGLVEMLRFQSFSNRRNKEGGGVMLALFAIGLGLIVIGSLGVFFGRLIQASISRQREFLADASAVQFTRNPDGIAGALKKIGGAGLGSKMKTAKASEASHMFFSDGGLFSFGFKTHPPLDIRIKAIEEGWDGKFEASELPEVATPRKQNIGTKKRGGPLTGHFPPVIGMAAVESMGQEEARQLAAGKEVLRDLSGNWEEAAHDREKAQAVVFAMLLAEDEKLLAGEASFLEKSAGKEAARLALGWQVELRALHSSRKIALLDLTMPTLRNLSRLEHERFLKITKWLIVSDGRVDLFEFMLQRVVERHLMSHFDNRGFGKVRFTRLSQLANEANILISTMAKVGAETPKEQERAYRAATDGKMTFEPSASLDDLGKVLDRFDEASPPVKKELLIACGRAAASDGDLNNREAELLRSIADAIGCPIPPFLATLKKTAV
ncbi:MAG: M48 family metallopeptidase [Akkermansiaceae bacterium]